MRSYASTVLAALVLTVLGCGAPPEDDSLGPAAGSYVRTASGPIRIPFEVYRDDIRMAAEVNGHPVQLLLDNGVLWDQLLFWGGPESDALELAVDGSIDVAGSGDGDPVPSSTASGVEVRFPGIVFVDQPAVIAPASAGYAAAWEGSVGQISAAFFKNFVVDVNWDESVITLIPPQEFAPAAGSRPLRMRSMGNGAWTVQARLEVSGIEPVERTLYLDLGDGNPLQLVTTGPDGVPLPERHVESSLGFGAQGEIRGAFGRVEALQLAGFELSDVIAAFVSEPGENPIDQRSYVGLPVLERFNLSFDYHHSVLHILPNSSFNERFNIGMVGVRLRSVEDGVEVVEVLPGSIAEQAGIEPGDVLVEVGGRSLTGVRPWQLESDFRIEGARLDVVFRHGEQRRTATLTLHPII